VISIIVAIQAKDRGIGSKNGLIFRISDDLKRFRALTTGHPIIMGRKTFESIGKPLPNRTNIVISRNTDLKMEGVTFCKTLEEAIEKAREIDENIFVIGGGEIFKQALPFTDRIEMTVVESDSPADVFFPDYSEFSKIISEEKHIDEKTSLKYSWITLSR
jgi:dihydrofolate reductase